MMKRNDEERRTRVGVVYYLNTQPLVYGLEKEIANGEIHNHKIHSPEKSLFNLIYGSPSQCSDLLSERKVDITILPVIEYARSDRYKIVPGISISSRGDAGSVLLFSKKIIQDIKTIALDESSRTSSALLRVLCFEKFNIRPHFIQMPPEASRMLEKNDAALIIGDQALFVPRHLKEVVVSDLGRDWFEMTSLPFVFAFWAGYPDVPFSCLDQIKKSKSAGLKKFKEISEQYLFHGTALPDLAYSYLSNNMRYSLGEEEKNGLELFYDFCLKHKLIKKKVSLKFYA